MRSSNGEADARSLLISPASSSRLARFRAVRRLQHLQQYLPIQDDLCYFLKAKQKRNRNKPRLVELMELQLVEPRCEDFKKRLDHCEDAPYVQDDHDARHTKHCVPGTHSRHCQVGTGTNCTSGPGGPKSRNKVFLLFGWSRYNPAVCTCFSPHHVLNTTF